ncbi:acyl-CoA thioesterase [Brumimicrobium mesophilum]|uniref:acyl-CoA thioesterase n=1 Tax=Brumimicrobium mesophilum TaxID=392717 RepID=UPI000D141F7C|nr:acyl-CoA thioesterase [Brumimicrobium mesophilum]
MKAKSPKESLTVTTKIVLPNDTNPHGNLFGGQLLGWMDVTSAISAQRHSRRVVVTASVNNVSFGSPIKESDVVTLEAKVSRAFTSSMEVFIDVFIENQVSGVRTKINEAIYTFVAVDQNGGPISVPKIQPETEEEKDRYEGALRRKQLSLILAGKMNPEEATELKRLFLPEEEV